MKRTTALIKTLELLIYRGERSVSAAPCEFDGLFSCANSIGKITCFSVRSAQCRKSDCLLVSAQFTRPFCESDCRLTVANTGIRAGGAYPSQVIEGFVRIRPGIDYLLHFRCGCR